MYERKKVNTLASINRNILECKLTIDKSDLDTVKVLIETYWNVNKNVPRRKVR